MPYFGSHEESSGTNQSQGAAPADADASRSPGQTSASGPSKANRPSSVRLPSPGPSRMQPSSPRIQYSSSHQRNASAQTPSGPTSNDGGWSPSYVAPGPMSPSASGNLGTNSFIFPIRSVFQGINPSSDQGQGGSQQGTQGDQKSGPSNLNRRPSGAQRAVSRSDAYDGSSRRPSRASIAEGYDDDFMVSGTDVVGISTIAQMLEGVEMGGGGGGSSGGFSSMSKIDEKEDGAKRTTGHATFTGRQTQPKPLPSRDRDDHRPASTNVTPVTTDPPRPPHGFFSAPLRGGERADTDPFSDFAKEVRRSSDGDELSTRGPFHTFTSQSSISGDESGSSLRDGSASHQPSRPTVTQADSGETIPGRYAEAEERPENDSANAPDNGLLDKSKPPMGQPSEPATGINFRDRPGTTTGEEQSYDQVDSSKNVDTKPRTFGTARAPKPESTTQQPELLQPRPHRVGRTSSSVSSHGTSTNRQHGVTNLEHDEQGEPNVVNDYSGIVRLADIGSHSSMMGTGTGTGTGSGQGSGVGGQSSNVKQSRKHKKERPIAENSSLSSGGPTGARLAQQQREVKDNNSRNTVQNFVNQQAHTTNLLDPNAPTPSPTPLSQSEDSETDGDNERAADERDSAQSSDVEAKWGARSESSLSVRESSEMATASTDDDDSRSRSQATDAKTKDEPIVTFRFEHVATDDGHHVVVGREGILQRCEDEPITTPGAVQGFGVLIVLEEDYEAETLIVRQVSENATELIGLSPRYLFGLDCFTRLLTEEQEDILRDNIEFLPDSESGRGSVEQEGPQVFLLSGFGEPGSEEDEDADSQGEASNRRREWTCWVAAHRPQQPTWNKVDEAGQPIPPPELIVLEFELERDIYNPLMQAFDRSDYADSDTPDSGSQTTLSRGSGPGRSSSFSSGGNNQASDGSLTTVASTPTPRPGLNTADSGESGSSGSMTTAQVQTKSSGQTTQNSGSTIRTSRGTGGHKPQGLEGIEVDHPLERIIESTTNHAKPLRALERMRRNGPFGESGSGRGSVGGSGSGGTSRGGTRTRRSQRRQQGSATGTMDVFAVLGQINEQLGGATDLEAFLKITVGVIQDLCRFHRVLIYQFDEAYNGQVVAELVEWGKTNDLYKGLMFPAADIPAQARQLYKINKVRMLYDRGQTTARLVLRSKEDLDHPLDMTHCYLRAMSPIHIKYLANMHVRSSMSVSIMAFGQLWGLIACHSYGHHGTRVSFPVRQMMRILSDSISRNIERLSYAQRLHTRKLISTIPTQQHPTGYIVSNADDLLEIFDADSGLLVIGDGCKLLGNNEQGTAMLAIAEFLRIMKFDTLKASNHLAKDYPDLVLPRAQDTIAGLLFVPLTAKAGQDFIVFLRKGQVREVQWAGKPYKDETSGSSASLEPRKSFKTWSETVIGRSRVWTDDQLESAGVLALIYGKFIQVWREKQTAMASNQLTAILLSNTSHAVRTPLSQIINTLELALAGNIDDDTRHMLENSHQASRALLFHVHDLLDLTRIETGNETAFNDPFDLRQSINDAVRLYQTESTRRGLEFKVVMADDLPASVIGDSRKIKTVISNLVANSVKFTEVGYIEVYCGIQKYADGQSREVTLNGFVPIEIVISDSGCGIPNDKLGAMFVTLEGAEEMKASSDNTGLGLGLAVVARIVEQLQGQLRAESEVGVGTRFFFTLQMLARSEEASSLNLRTASDPSDIESDVDARGVVHHRASSGSGGSILSAGGRSSGGSMVSKAASEIDSFVNDFASSHMMGPVSADDKRLVDAEARMSRPGTFPVTDSSYPVRPSRMDDNAEQNAESPSPVSTPMLSGPPTSPKQIQSSGSTTSLRPSRPAKGMQRGYSYHFTSSPTQSPKLPRVPQGSGSRHKKSPSMAYDPSQLSEKEAGKTRGDKNLRILVVEDDPINSQILQKRLKMDKHIAIPVTNGQEAVTFLREDRDIDCVLMDIQMPIMDGRTSANEIRKLEHSSEESDDITPLRIDGRIPILAVSASLYESDRSNLAQDFDGWLLKPLDFLRVRTLLTALENPSKRSKEVYQQGQWEKGGFFKADASWAQNHLERSYTAD